MRATSHTKLIWKQLKNKLESNWNDSQKSKKSKIGKRINEMAILNSLLKSKVNGWCKWRFFPKNKFVSGRYYRGGKFKNTDPAVIQNNWANGIYNKVRRAKLWKQWFLDKTGNFCLSKIEMSGKASFKTCPTNFSC